MQIVTPLYHRIGERDGLLKLLRHFYADVRQHEEIASIFAAKVEEWPVEKIADFWSGGTGGPALYRGGMPWKHVLLKLEAKHFEVWMGLWGGLATRTYLSQRQRS